jgi:deuterolysin
VPLKAGESYNTEIDAAAVHDLSDGAHTFYASGSIPYAEAGSTTLTGKSIAFKSNTITATVDGAAARRVRKEVSFVKRAIIADDCSINQKKIIDNTHQNCAQISGDAAIRVESPPNFEPLFRKFFKDNDDNADAHDLVFDPFLAVSHECSGFGRNTTTTHCKDILKQCKDNILTYSIPSENFIVKCPLFFTLPIRQSCNGQDMTTTTIHQMLLLPSVASPVLQEIANGVEAAEALDANSTLNNADSYALFAGWASNPSCRS